MRRATGNARNQPIPEPVPVGDQLYDLPDPPKEIGEIAQAVWREIGPDLVDVGVLRSSDLIAFEAMCQSVQRMRDAAAVIKQDGVISEGSTGQKRAHPALDIERQAATEFRQWATRFGLDPSSRTKLGADRETAGDQSPDDGPVLEVSAGGG
jgi:P27 family predicted phage terminase small subunit